MRRRPLQPQVRSHQFAGVGLRSKQRQFAAEDGSGADGGEAARVLAPGGRLMVLEFSQMPVPMLQWLYDRYSFNVIPAMGQMVAGDRDSYQYLVESIRRFPEQEAFATMIRQAGFGQVKYRNLSMGIAALHSGWKL